MPLLKRVIICTAASPFVTAYFVHMYNVHYTFSPRNKTEYPLSVWKESTKPKERETIIKQREPIVNALRNFLEMKGQDIDEVSKYFVEGVTYEDPYLRCISRKELFDCYLKLPLLVKNTSTKRFEVTHSQDLMHIAFDRTTVMRNGSMFTYLATSTMTVKFCKENNGEKVISISDEWCDTPLLNPKNSPRIGKIFVLYRRVWYYMSNSALIMAGLIDNAFK